MVNAFSLYLYLLFSKKKIGKVNKSKKRMARRYKRNGNEVMHIYGVAFPQRSIDLGNQAMCLRKG